MKGPKTSPTHKWRLEEAKKGQELRTFIVTFTSGLGGVLVFVKIANNRTDATADASNQLREMSSELERFCAREVI